MEQSVLRLRLDEERKTNRLQKTAIEQLEQRIKKIDSQHAKTEKEKEEYQDALAEKLRVSLATQEARLNKIIQEHIEENNKLKEIVNNTTNENTELQEMIKSLSNISQNLQDESEQLRFEVNDRCNTITNLNRLIELQANQIKDLIDQNTQQSQENKQLNRLWGTTDKGNTPKQILFQKKSHTVQHPITNTLLKQSPQNNSSQSYNGPDLRQIRFADNTSDSRKRPLEGDRDELKSNQRQDDDNDCFADDQYNTLDSRKRPLKDDQSKANQIPNHDAFFFNDLLLPAVETRKGKEPASNANPTIERFTEKGRLANDTRPNIKGKTSSIRPLVYLDTLSQESNDDPVLIQSKSSDASGKLTQLSSVAQKVKQELVNEVLPRAPLANATNIKPVTLLTSNLKNLKPQVEAELKKGTEHQHANGAACIACEKFYDTEPLPDVQDNNRLITSKERIKLHSRHKARETTPPGFWELGFPASFSQ